MTGNAALPLTAPLATLAARLHAPDTDPETLTVSGYRSPQGPQALRPAAVLIPILLEPEPTLLLTVRASHMHLHAGQVALPGGGREAQEAFPLTTVLRETQEETGIAPEQVEVLGLLDRYDTISGYRIVPVVGCVRGRPELRPCPGEVDTLFTVPLAEVLDEQRYRRHFIARENERYELLSLPHPRWMIWGATAAILHQLSLLA